MFLSIIGRLKLCLNLLHLDSVPVVYVQQHGSKVGEGGRVVMSVNGYDGLFHSSFVTNTSTPIKSMASTKVMARSVVVDFILFI
jgi:hypothetical protein